MGVENECVACLALEDTPMRPLDRDVALTFTELTNLEINDGYRICHNCAENLMAFKDFKEQCIRSSEIIQQRTDEFYEDVVKIEDQRIEFEIEGLVEIDDEVEEEKQEQSDEKVTCEYCSTTLGSMTSYRKHVKLKHPDIDMPTPRQEALCPFEGCDRIFHKQDRLDAHLRTHEGKKAEICPTCGKEFSTIRNLRRHLLIHTDTKEYACQYCSKTFATAVSKKNHENMHTKEKSYICDTCGQVFHHRSGLAIHQNRHIDEKRYKCTECPRAYKSKVELNDHLTRHKGVRSHICDICNKTFLVRKDLKLHERMVHKAQPKYECTECHKKYRKKCQLESHMRVHTGERPYTCTYCGKGFRVKQTLIKHTYSHTGEKPFKCPVCPKAYTEIFIMKRHMKQQHENHLQTKENQTTNSDANSS